MEVASWFLQLIASNVPIKQPNICKKIHLTTKIINKNNKLKISNISPIKRLMPLHPPLIAFSHRWLGDVNHTRHPHTQCGSLVLAVMASYRADQLAVLRYLLQIMARLRSVYVPLRCTAFSAIHATA